MNYAYCWRSGLIDFGKIVPEDAIEIARCKNKKKLYDAVEMHAHGEPSGLTELTIPLVDLCEKDDGKLIALKYFTFSVKRTLGQKTTDLEPFDFMAFIKKYTNEKIKDMTKFSIKLSKQKGKL